VNALALILDRIQALAIVSVAAMAAACASVTNIPPQPFVDFEASIAQLKASSDAALSIEQQIVYERYLEQWRASGSVEDLQLQASETPSPFSMEPPGAILFRDIQEARAKLADLNSLVLRYAGTLNTLTGAAEDSITIDADAVASELRSSATALGARLGMAQTLPDGYFFGFGTLANNYLENKRRQALAALLQSAQAEIEVFAEAGQQICQISGLGIQAEYSAAFSKLTAGAATLPDNRRDSLVQSILDLNEETLRQLETLRLVYEAYGALPAAHRNLQDTSSGEASFTDLLTYAELLKRRYTEFSEE
jgi:hypothetical protein